jgi:hypothetical protein
MSKSVIASSISFNDCMAVRGRRKEEGGIMYKPLV